MSILRKEATGFTQITNELLNNDEITFKEKGLFAYLFSKPDGWDFSGDRIASETSEGRRAIYSGLTKLEEHGFILRKKLDSGKMEYLLLNKGLNSPVDGFSNLLKPQFAKTGSISNKEKKVINKNTYSKTSSSVSDSISSSCLAKQVEEKSNTVPSERAEKTPKADISEVIDRYHKQFEYITGTKPIIEKVDYIKVAGILKKLPKEKVLQMVSWYVKMENEKFKKHPNLKSIYTVENINRFNLSK